MESAARVLLVDDDPKVLRLLEATLRLKDYEVQKVETGAEALELLKQDVPDLIISDIMMPDLDGYDFLRRVRSMTRANTVPFIFLSARSEPEDVVRGLRLGADEFLRKPFSIDELLVRVERVLDRAGGGAAGEGSRRADGPSRGAFEGDLGHMGVPDVLRTLCVQRKTGLLRVDVHGVSGSASLQVEEGHVVHCEWGRLPPEHVVFQLVFATRGRFSFRPGEALPGHTIEAQTLPLLMEAYRLMDAGALRRVEPSQPDAVAASVQLVAAARKGRPALPLIADVAEEEDVPLPASYSELILRLSVEREARGSGGAYVPSQPLPDDVISGASDTGEWRGASGAASLRALPVSGGEASLRHPDSDFHDTQQFSVVDETDEDVPPIAEGDSVHGVPRPGRPPSVSLRIGRTTEGEGGADTWERAGLLEEEPGSLRGPAPRPGGGAAREEPKEELEPDDLQALDSAEFPPAFATGELEAVEAEAKGAGPGAGSLAPDATGRIFLTQEVKAVALVDDTAWEAPLAEEDLGSRSAEMMALYEKLRAVAIADLEAADVQLGSRSGRVVASGIRDEARRGTVAAFSGQAIAFATQDPHGLSFAILDAGDLHVVVVEVDHLRVFTALFDRKPDTEEVLAALRPHLLAFRNARSQGSRSGG
jgi:CheY-like chemotaxis protein